jgi:PAS domain S-box-containing protein
MIARRAAAAYPPPGVRSLTPSMPLRGAAIVLGTAVVYVAAAKLGLSMALPGAPVTAVWPPSGIAVVVLFLAERRWAVLGVALGAFVANVTEAEPPLVAAAIAVGNTLEAIVAARLLVRAGVQPALERLRDALGLVFVAAASPTVAASIGVAALCAAGVQPWSAAAGLAWVWWIGDAIGILLVVPFALTWRPTAWTAIRRRGEAIVFVATTTAVGLGVFGGRVPVSGYPLHYTVFPLVIWAALRFGPRGTAAVTTLVSALAIGSTVRGVGPFAMARLPDSLLTLQLFMAVVAVTGLVLAAAIAERDASRRQATRDLARLALSEGRLRLALDAGRMGVWDWNIPSGEVSWSGHLESIFGLPPGGFGGTLDAFRALVHPDDRVLVQDAIDGALDGADDYEVEFRSRRPDGSIAWMSAKGSVVRDGRGRPVRMLGVGMDVTERRRLAETLRERADELAESDRRKDEFLAMLAHELRNPLAPLSTALELLRGGQGPTARVLEIAGRQVRQLVRLVDDLLDVSRITQGKVTLRKEVTTLDDVVGRAVETVRQSAEQQGLALHVDLPRERVRLEADPARLAQVFANLLGNAVKYTLPGGSVCLTAVREPGGVTVRVADTGAGIAPELLPYVFDVFVQGDRSLDRTRGGLGIGLTIVRQLVELHDGRIEARSDGPNAGSEFVVHLPTLARSDGAAAPATAHASAARDAAPARVLVVEDNPDSGDSLGMLLDMRGHETRVVTSGRAALELVERWAPDVVVSDIGLPGMDGYELVRALRGRPALAGVTFIALSGYGRDEDRRRAFEAGFDHHLVKPPDVEVLASLLDVVPRARTA